MNIFSQLSIYANSNLSIYRLLKMWSESVSRDLNESSLTCYPNGLRGFSFGDRLNAVVYITLAYLHRKIHFEKKTIDILPIPGTNYEYWQKIINTSIDAQRAFSNDRSKYNDLLSELFDAVYNYSDWQSFISSTIGFFDDDDEETVKAFSFMFSKYHTYDDNLYYQQRKLTKEEIANFNHCIFHQYGIFTYILPQSLEKDYEEIPFIDRLYMRHFIPVWDKNNKYKQGDLVTIDDNCEVIFSKRDACMILY